MKVQYPASTTRSAPTSRASDVLFRALSLMFPGLDPGPLVDELRARLVEELDYAHEAENQRLFTDYYAGHPFIRIPAVVDELSTARVLTTEFAHGARFAEVEHWSQAERDLAAEAIFRFVFRSLYRLHAFNGDPHPGTTCSAGTASSRSSTSAGEALRPRRGRAVRGADPRPWCSNTTSRQFRRVLEGALDPPQGCAVRRRRRARVLRALLRVRDEGRSRDDEPRVRVGNGATLLRPLAVRTRTWPRRRTCRPRS